MGDHPSGMIPMCSNGAYISRTPKRLLALIWPIRANKRVSTISARGSATGRLRLREPRIAHNFAQTCPFPTKLYTPIETALRYGCAKFHAKRMRLTFAMRDSLGARISSISAIRAVSVSDFY